MNPNLQALRKVLAQLYPDERSIRRLVDDANIDATYIAFNSTAINIWHSVLTEAEKRNQVVVLLDMVENEYADSKELQRALSDYRKLNGKPEHPYGTSMAKRQAKSRQLWLSAIVATVLLSSIGRIVWYLDYFALQNDRPVQVVIAADSPTATETPAVVDAPTETVVPVATEPLAVTDAPAVLNLTPQLTASLSATKIVTISAAGDEQAPNEASTVATPSNGINISIEQSGAGHTASVNLSDNTGATPTLVPTAATTDLRILDAGLSDNTYLIEGAGSAQINIGTDLVVYGEPNPGTEVAIARLLVVGKNPETLTAQALLIDPAFKIRTRMRVDDNLAYLAESQLVPVFDYVVGYLLQPDRLRLRPNHGLVVGTSLQALAFERSGEAIIDAFPLTPASQMQITALGVDGEVAAVDLLTGTWPVTGTIVGLLPGGIAE